ncbi:MAG: ADP-ribosylglycohydrolase family protein [Coriobacteriia bacterium]|nr:ADP-ribosylglycohydrolase family protein [Coriobacteriia bacterium]
MAELDYTRVRGALIGAAYGDAFGMPVEGWSARRIVREVGLVDHLMPGMPDNDISRGLAAGEVTDDTMHTLFVIEMLAETGGRVDARLFLEKLRRWATTCPKSTAVLGPSTRRALEQIDAGVPMEQTGSRGYTNGGAMKMAPLGIVFGDPARPERIVDAAEAISLPTHHTGVAIAAASAIGAAVGAAVRGAQLNSVLDAAGDAADLGELRGVDFASASVAARIEMARGLSIPEDVRDLIGCSPLACESVPAALAFVQLSGGDPRVCACMATAAGSDTDTVASMACAICGGLRGEDAFDPEDVALIERVNGLNFGALAEQLIAIEKAVREREARAGE